MADTEPIPLRTLTVLLNYERLISDPRFENERLDVSSLSDPEVINLAKTRNPKFMDSMPKSIEHQTMNQFRSYDEPTSTGTPSTICLIHPQAAPLTHNLTFAERERIYHESRGHDGCYKAIGLYQYFFNLLPPGQKLSVRVKNEEPVLVDPKPRSIIELGMVGPKINSISLVPSKPLTLATGFRDGENHAIIGFPYPGSEIIDVVVDMTRLQYGDVGKGNFGEPYFLGSMEDYTTSMDKICNSLENRGIAAYMNPSSDISEEPRLKACAEKVWSRWQNRTAGFWCDYCGKGGEKLMACAQCKKVKVRYCCKEHQVSGWKLHKHICEKVK